MGLQQIKGLKEKLAAVKKEMEVVGKTALTEAFQEIFAKYPQLKAVKWEQYTPYFNDGDACTFRVGEMRAQFDGMVDEEDGGDYEDGFIGTLAYHSDDLKTVYDWQNRRKTDHPLQAVFDDLGQISDAEDMLESVFGDHQEIIVHRDGTIEQEEYSHD